MDLIDRYLGAVKLLLPLGQRDDIAAELRDVLVSRREEREAELGRPLTRDEDAALLRAFGNPISVAGRYGGQQTVIGPELYPLYALVTAVLTGLAAVSAVIRLSLATIVPGIDDAAVGITARSLISGPLTMIGLSTLGFALLDRSPWRANVLRILNDWDPRELPAVPRNRALTGWPHHVAGIVVQLVFLLCWTRIIPLWRLVLPAHPGAVSISFAPALAMLYWPVMGLALGAIVVELAALMGSRYRRLYRALAVASYAAAFVVAGVALKAGNWTVTTALGLTPPAAAQALGAAVNLAFEVSLWAVMAGAAIAVVQSLWRLIRGD